MDLGVIEVLAIVGVLSIVYWTYRVISFFRPQRRYRRW